MDLEGGKRKCREREKEESSGEGREKTERGGEREILVCNEVKDAAPA